MVSRCSRATTAKKCTKKRDVVLCPKLKDKRAAPLSFSRGIALGTRMGPLYELRSTRVVMRLLLLDIQHALYLWSNSSYTPKGFSSWARFLRRTVSKRVPYLDTVWHQKRTWNRFLTLFQWDINGRKLERVFSPRTCSGKRDQTHVTGKDHNTMQASSYPKRNTPENVSYHSHVHFLIILVASSTPYEQTLFCLRRKWDSAWLKPLRSPQPKLLH